MQSLSHWRTSLILIDLSKVTCRQLLPSDQLDGWTTAQRAGRQRACRSCSALLLLCTSHLQSVQWNVNRNAGLISINAAVCFTRLPSPITADHYRYSRHISIGGDEHQHIVFTDMQRHKYSLTNIRYRSNAIVFRQSHLETVPQDNTTIFSLFQYWISLSRVRIRI